MKTLQVTKNRGLYGVAIGCKGKCENNPCKNNGECLEGYDHFTCNCRWTPFKEIMNIFFMRVNKIVFEEYQGSAAKRQPQPCL